MIRLIGHLMAAIEQLLTPHTSQHMIYMSSWTKRRVRPGPSMDLGSVLRRRITAIKTIILIEYQLEINNEHNNRQQHAMTHPNTGVPCTPYVSPMRCWITNFQRDSNP